MQFRVTFYLTSLKLRDYSLPTIDTLANTYLSHYQVHQHIFAQDKQEHDQFNLKRGIIRSSGSYTSQDKVFDHIRCAQYLFIEDAQAVSPRNTVQPITLQRTRLNLNSRVDKPSFNKIEKNWP